MSILFTLNEKYVVKRGWIVKRTFVFAAIVSQILLSAETLVNCVRRHPYDFLSADTLMFSHC